MTAGIALVVGGAVVLGLGVEAAAAGLRLIDPRREGPGRPLPWPAVSVAAGLTAAIAAAHGATAAAAGLALGGALFAVGVILGVGLLSAPLRGTPPPAAILLPGLTLVAGAVALGDEIVTRVEGAGLLLLYALYLYLAAPSRAGGTAGLPGPALAPDPEPTARRGPLAGALIAAGLVAGGMGAWVLSGGVVRASAATALAPGLVGVLAGVPAAWDTLRASAAVPGRPPRLEAVLDAVAGVPAAIGLAALVAPLAVDAAVLTAYIALCCVWTLVAAWVLLSDRGARILGALLVAALVLWARLTLHLL